MLESITMSFIDLSKTNAYVIKCADWAIVIQADSSQEACTQALTQKLNKEGKKLKLSSVIISEKIENIDYSNTNEDYCDEIEGDYVEYHSVSRMLANAGLHELSSNVKFIFGA